MAAEAAVAQLVSVLPDSELAELSPVDVLRLAMLLAVRRGDLAVASRIALRLVPVWQPWMDRSPGAVTVARLAGLLGLADLASDPASVRSPGRD